MGFIPDRSRLFTDRFSTFKEMARYRAMLHNLYPRPLDDLPAFENLTGLVLSPDSPPLFCGRPGHSAQI